MSFPYNRAVYVIEQHICYHLNLGSSGQGSAPVATNPVSSCPPGYFPWGYQVNVTASPAPNWQIGGWNGTENDAATGSPNFVLMPAQDHTTLVQYVPVPEQLSVTKAGNGAGTVTSDLLGINCGATCSAFFPYGTTVTLSGTPALGSSFLGFSGGSCNGGTPTVTAATVCTAVFSLVSTNFYTVPPCRLLDTRIASDPNSPAIAAGEYRLPVLTGSCGIPTTAKALSLNLTIVNPSSDGFLSLYPALGVPPSTSTINFRQGQVRANNTVMSLNLYGGLTVYCGMPSGSVDYIIDVNGYFQ
jgi:Divergent InlB B-repeat domain